MISIDQYWQNFLSIYGLPLDTKYYEAFAFAGFSDEGSDELLDLVLQGKKKATTSLYIDEEKYPHVGSYSIVLNSKGEPKCVIQTTNYRIMRFKDMNFDIASKEGEDETIDTWIFNHSVIFSNEAKEYGFTFNSDTPIFFEEFEMVYM